MTLKLRYEIDLSCPVEVDAVERLEVRSLSDDDLDALARLMLDAYVGTIDYEGETLDEAIDEVRGFLEDQRSLPDRSFVVVDNGRIVSAIFILMVEDDPFVGVVMTLPSHKRQGLGRLVTNVAIQHLASDGHERAVLYITDGNVASEALFRSVGAVRCDI